jgi:small-conductance mechanosensitive channel
MPDKKSSNALIGGLTLVALLLMIAVYFMPIWWVSLTAPQYPKDAFPDGIRIHFHFNGVYNGCKTAGKGSRLASEVTQKDLGGGGDERYNAITDAKKNMDDEGAQALDCVHEMNTINHYVGMYPIASGAPVEKPLAKFFFGFFGIMLLAFAVTHRKLRLTILGVGFMAVAAWTIVDQYALGHLASHVANYMNETGTYFKDTQRIHAWGNNVATISNIVIATLIVVMAVVFLGVWKIRRFELILAAVPALLPVFFIIEYSAWLWFFGHTLNPWGAFTLKPFMPTVFGEGKVAQFSTYSYPYWGYAMLLLIFVCLVVALLLRRQQLRQETAD